MENNYSEFDQVIEKLMLKKGEELDSAIEKLRKENLYSQASALKSRLAGCGRCQICTLKYPCKHYKSSNEVVDPIISPDSSVIFAKTPESKSFVQVTLTPNIKKFKIRYRGKKTESPKMLVKKSDEFEKLKLMEKLEKYKEEKLQKELQHIESIKKAEEFEKTRIKELEKRKEVYFERQKMKIKEYKDSLMSKIEDLERQKFSFEVQEKAAESFSKRLNEEKKKKVIEFRTKRKESLSEEILTKRPKKPSLKPIKKNQLKYIYK